MVNLRLILWLIVMNNGYGYKSGQHYNNSLTYNFLVIWG